MKTEKNTYENPSVERVVANVRAGIRTRENLKFCGCPICRKALEILGDEQTEEEWIEENAGIGEEL